MKVSYPIAWSGGMSSGVFQKVRLQTKLWNEMALDVEVFVLTRSEAEAAWSSLDPGVAVRTYVYSSRASRLIAFLRWRSGFQSSNADIIYRRLTRADGSWLNRGRVPVVAEVNSVLSERRKCRSDFSGAPWAACSGLVAVSQELVRRLSGSAVASLPTVVVPNGVDLRDVETIPRAPNYGKRDVTLAFVGTRGQPWHGLDRLIEVAQMFPDWGVLIIGGHDPLPESPSNVIWLGELSGSELADLYAHVDVAVGTLSLDKKGLSSTSALKVPQYLAHGLPIILAYDDCQVSSSANYALRLPASGSLKHCRDQIGAFVQAWRGKRVPRQDIEHIDARRLEKVRVQFLNRMAEKVNHA